MKKLLPIVVIFTLFSAQVLYTFNSESQIRYEELSESVRSVFWLEKGLVFSGINAHLGWYTSLRVIYNIFGFSFEYAKYFKLFLDFVAIVCLCLLLNKIFGFKKSLIPIVAIFLSPTLLFFNSLRNHYGVDLQYLAIILYILSKVSFKGRLNFVPHILVWSLSMLAASAYPSFLYYLPAIFIFYVYRFLKSDCTARLKFIYALVSFAAFLIPIILMILQVNNKQLLIFDPKMGGGLFRGPAHLITNPMEVLQKIYDTSSSLMGFTYSYYYEVKEAEFSMIFPLVSIITAICLSLLGAFKKKINKIIVGLIILTFFINLLSIGFLSDNSGLSTVRRATPILACLYGLYTLAYIFVLEGKFKKTTKYILFFLLLLLPIHHLIVYPKNLIHLSDQSPYREQIWFNTPVSPENSLKNYVEIVKKQDLMLSINYPQDVSFGYVYNWIYSSISGYCLWNHLKCHKIYGFDINKGKFVQLNLDLVNYTHD